MNTSWRSLRAWRSSSLESAVLTMKFFLFDKDGDMGAEILHPVARFHVAGFWYIRLIFP
jgi:hypothetical protein